MTDLYRYYDADGRLLYIGISLNAVARATQHRADKHWWNDVARMTVEKIPGDRRHALEVERQAIRDEGPLHNVVHNGRSESGCSLPGRYFIWRLSDGQSFGGRVLDDDEDYAYDSYVVEMTEIGVTRAAPMTTFIDRTTLLRCLFYKTEVDFKTWVEHFGRVRQLHEHGQNGAR